MKSTDGFWEENPRPTRFCFEKIFPTFGGQYEKWIGLLAVLMLALVCATALGETNTQVKHYLMLGEDGYAEHVTDDARTDTIVLVSLDTKYNRVILTSILRDSKINNPRGNETKINLLYKNHGFSGIISCLERELDIQIEGRDSGQL